jgi:hypothetical protein
MLTKRVANAAIIALVLVGCDKAPSPQQVGQGQSPGQTAGLGAGAVAPSPSDAPKASDRGAALAALAAPLSFSAIVVRLHPTYT